LTGPSLAVFVSPHGFGHAARASAVMQALARVADVRFEVYAATPRWFFDESIAGQYRYHELHGDVGFVQPSALTLDLHATVSALGALLPFDDVLLDGLALEIGRAGCRAVLCDIAPLGIAVAERARIPSILVENFTWPWIYEPLLGDTPALAPLSAELQRWFSRAAFHVQTEPFCHPEPRAALVVPPVSRQPRRARAEVRRDLGLDTDAPAVVVTLGGIPQPLAFVDRMRAASDVTFLVTGAAVTRTEGNVHLYDNDTRIYMPDFVRAADAVVAKLGYSTVAEVWREGRPLGWIARSDFREVGPLGAWVAGRLPGFEIEPTEFASGRWLDRLPDLLSMEPPTPGTEGGAERVARFVVEEVLGG